MKLVKYHSQVYGKNYDLKFLRFSKYHAIGTIKENMASWQKRHINGIFTPNENIDAAYKTLFYFMEKYPNIKNHILKEFFEVLRPMLNQGTNHFSKLNSTEK